MPQTINNQTVWSQDELLLSNHTNIFSVNDKSSNSENAFNTVKSVLQLSGLSSTINSLTGNHGYSFNTDDVNLYSTTPFHQLRRIPFADFTDYRASIGGYMRRLDGLDAAKRNKTIKSWNSYYVSSIGPLGAYAKFHLNADGKKGYGWGNHGDINARIFKTDFTLQSNVAKEWDTAEKVWKQKTDYHKLIPFRGDRVNVIDYSKRSLENVYRWKDTIFTKPSKLTSVLGKVDSNLTQDFIKFYITGPKLHNGNTTDIDDVIVFRATLTTLEDTFSPQWTPVQMLGRADSNFHYNSFDRHMSISFIVLATDRDEMRPIWRKLNALAGFTAPIYDTTTIGLIAPWMRITIGDLLKQQPVLIDSLSYTLTDQDTQWEINIEQDSEMKQAPIKISVSMNLRVITDYLPERNGQFYTLSDSNDKYGSKNDTSNWLSDKDNQSINRANNNRPGPPRSI